GAAAPASAGATLGRTGRLVYRIGRSAVVGIGFDGTAVAGCPRGTLAIGSGGDVRAAVGSAWLSALRLRDGTDEDALPDDGALVTAHGPQAARIRGFAICIDRGVLVPHWVTEFVDPGEPERVAFVGCSLGGTVALSGGVTFETSLGWIASLWPYDDGDPGETVDDGWAVSLFDAGGGDTPARLDLVCASRTGPISFRRSLGVPLAPGGSAVATVRCKRGSHAISGGVSAIGSADDVRVTASIPWDGADRDRVPDDGWRVRADRHPAGALGAVTAWVTCLRR
ncbi:MAG: hypothetical protein ACKOTZ_08235, partial [Chloroflexota bacterium]